MTYSRNRRPQPGELAIVVGAGRSGLAAAKLLRKLGARVRLLEKNPAVATELVQAEALAIGAELLTGEHNPAQFEHASFVVPSPGMPMASLMEFIPADSHAEIISEMELAWRCLEDEPVLAVTGTSGKTTTASLAAAMLKTQGYSVFLGGNIGTPLSEYVLDSRKANVIVVEISSFQLQACSSFAPRAGILLNITPNHLDYHKDMEEYTDAKFRLFRGQDENDLAILDSKLVNVAEKYRLRARKIWLEEKECQTFPDMRLIGAHNAYNAEAAWLACRLFGVSRENAAIAVANFRPLPHRLESVRELDGVIYINDSKCTTVSSLKVALEAMDRPVQLLCGGKFKGGDLAALRDIVGKKVKHAALFGASREIFENAWKGVIPMSWHKTLGPAVLELKSKARQGDVVLLAPATSSFDLYKNYMERGEDFKKIVGALA